MAPIPVCLPLPCARPTPVDVCVMTLLPINVPCFVFIGIPFVIILMVCIIVPVIMMIIPIMILRCHINRSKQSRA